MDEGIALTVVGGGTGRSGLRFPNKETRKPRHIIITGVRYPPRFDLDKAPLHALCPHTDTWAIYYWGEGYWFGGILGPGDGIPGLRATRGRDPGLRATQERNPGPASDSGAGSRPASDSEAEFRPASDPGVESRTQERPGSGISDPGTPRERNPGIPRGAHPPVRVLIRTGAGELGSGEYVSLPELMGHQNRKPEVSPFTGVVPEGFGVKEWGEAVLH